MKEIKLTEVSVTKNGMEAGYEIKDKKPKVDKEALGIIKKQKEQALKTNQTVKK